MNMHFYDSPKNWMSQTRPQWCSVTSLALTPQIYNHCAPDLMCNYLIEVHCGFFFNKIFLLAII